MRRIIQYSIVFGVAAFLLLQLIRPQITQDKQLAGLEMIDIDPGDYNLTILVPNSQGRKYHSRQVSLNNRFQISKYEITIDQWNACFGDGGCPHKAKQRRYQEGDHPVTKVSWINAYRFTQWLSASSGKNFRLPTEEEWGYVAFAGEDFTRELIDDLILERQMLRTTPLGRFRKTSKVGVNGENKWAIADLTGPVWEWTMTCRFSSDDESRKKWSVAQLSDPNFCPNRVVQGEERAHVPYFVDEVISGGCGTGAPVDNIGFRVVRAVID